jgi:hypothetical protein
MVPYSLQFPGWEQVVLRWMPAHWIAGSNVNTFLQYTRRESPIIHKMIVDDLYELNPNRGGPL